MKDGSSIVKNGNPIVFDENVKMYYINFEALELTDGDVINITVLPHYTTSNQKENGIPSYKFTFKVNDGVNVYTEEEMRNAYSDIDIKVINLHSNILIDKDNFNGTKGITCENLGFNDVHIDYTNSANNGEYVNNPYNSLDPIGRYSIFYRRPTVDDSIRISGNYFSIDASQVPLVVDTLNDCFKKGEKAKIVYLRCSIFFYIQETIEESPLENVTLNLVERDSEGYNKALGEKSVRVYKEAQINIDNLQLAGNGTLLSTEDSFSKDSGSIDGLIYYNAAAIMNNCVIHNLNEAIKNESHSILWENEVLTIKKNLCVVDQCSIYDNWNNSGILEGDSTFIYRDSKVYSNLGFLLAMKSQDSYTASKFLATGGPVIIPNEIDWENGEDESTVDTYFSFFPVYANDNSIMENWLAGDEAYCANSGIGSQIAAFKGDSNSGLIKNVNDLTNNQYTLFTTKKSLYSPIERVNLIAMVDGHADMSYGFMTYTEVDEIKTPSLAVRTPLFYQDGVSLPGYSMSVDVGGGNYMNNVMKDPHAPDGKLLWPLGELSDTTKLMSLMNGDPSELVATLTAEGVSYCTFIGGVLQQQISLDKFDEAKVDFPMLYDFYGDSLKNIDHSDVSVNPLGLTAANSDDWIAIVSSKIALNGIGILFTHVIKEQGNHPVYVEMTVPSIMNQGNGLSSIICEIVEK